MTSEKPLFTTERRRRAEQSTDPCLFTHSKVLCAVSLRACCSVCSCCSQAMTVGFVMFEDDELNSLDFTIDEITLREEFVSKQWSLAKLIKTWKLTAMDSSVRDMTQPRVTSRCVAIAVLCSLLLLWH